MVAGRGSMIAGRELEDPMAAGRELEDLMAAGRGRAAAGRGEASGGFGSRSELEFRPRPESRGSITPSPSLHATPIAKTGPGIVCTKPFLARLCMACRCTL
jgi:hypothetical protein